MKRTMRKIFNHFFSSKTEKETEQAQHRKSPLFYLAAGFFTFRGLFVLTLFLIIAPKYWKARTEIKAKQQAFSQEVQSQIQNRRRILENHSKRMEERFREHEERLARSSSRSNNQSGSRQDSSQQSPKAERLPFWKELEKARSECKKSDECNTERQKQEVDACDNMPLSSSHKVDEVWGASMIRLILQIL